MQHNAALPLMRLAVNVALDEADELLGESVTDLRDFEKGKQTACSQKEIRTEIAKAALCRIHGEAARDAAR